MRNSPVLFEVDVGAEDERDDVGVGEVGGDEAGGRGVRGRAFEPRLRGG
jgi:hypothetical protein